MSRVGACACTALVANAIPTATRALAGKARIIKGSLDFVGGCRYVPGCEKGEPATHNEEYREYYNYGQTPHLGLSCYRSKLGTVNFRLSERTLRWSSAMAIVRQFKGLNDAIQRLARGIGRN